MRLLRAPVAGLVVAAALLLTGCDWTGAAPPRPTRSITVVATPIAVPTPPARTTPAPPPVTTPSPAAPGAPAPTTSPPTTTPPPPAVPPIALPPGVVPGLPGQPAVADPRALPLTGTTLDGQQVDASLLAGRPVVTWFWTPDCAPCADMAPAMAAVAAEYDGRVAFASVVRPEDAAAAREFVARHRLAFPTLVDAKAWTDLGVTTPPTTAFATADGQITQRQGPLDEAAVRAGVDEVLAP